MDKSQALTLLNRLAQAASGMDVLYNPAWYNELKKFIEEPIHWMPIETADKKRGITWVCGRYNGRWWMSEAYWHVEGLGGFWTSGELWDGEKLAIDPTHWAEWPNEPK